MLIIKRYTFAVKWPARMVGTKLSKALPLFACLLLQTRTAARTAVTLDCVDRVWVLLLSGGAGLVTPSPDFSDSVCLRSRLCAFCASDAALPSFTSCCMLATSSDTSLL